MILEPATIETHETPDKPREVWKSVPMHTYLRVAKLPGCRDSPSWGTIYFQPNPHRDSVWVGYRDQRHGYFVRIA